MPFSQIVRLAFVFFWIPFGLLLAILTGAWINPYFAHVKVVKSWWCRVMYTGLGFRLTIHGQPLKNASLTVGNHISWIDPFFLIGQQATYFMVKAEARSWPVIGQLLRMIGCLFIKRGAGQVYQRIEDIAASIQAGNPVGVYPEATSTDGTNVKSFAPPLFRVITDKKCAMQVVGIFYPNSDNTGINTGINTAVPYIGEQSFLENLISITRPSPPKHAVLRYFDFPALPEETETELAIRAHKVLQNWVLSFYNTPN